MGLADSSVGVPEGCPLAVTCMVVITWFTVNHLEASIGFHMSSSVEHLSSVLVKRPLAPLNTLPWLFPRINCGSMLLMPLPVKIFGNLFWMASHWKAYMTLPFGSSVQDAPRHCSVHATTVIIFWPPILASAQINEPFIIAFRTRWNTMQRMLRPFSSTMGERWNRILAPLGLKPCGPFGYFFEQVHKLGWTVQWDGTVDHEDEKL